MTDYEIFSFFNTRKKLKPGFLFFILYNKRLDFRKKLGESLKLVPSTHFYKSIKKYGVAIYSFDNKTSFDKKYRMG